MTITSNDADFFTTGTKRVLEIKKYLVRILDKYKAYWAGNGVTHWTYEIVESQFDDADQVYQIDVKCGLIGSPKLHIICLNTYLAEYGPIERAKLKERLWENLLDEICLMGVVKAYQGTIEVLRNAKDSDGVLQHLRKNPLTPSEVLNPDKI